MRPSDRRIYVRRIVYGASSQASGPFAWLGAALRIGLAFLFLVMLIVFALPLLGLLAIAGVVGAFFLRRKLAGMQRDWVAAQQADRPGGDGPGDTLEGDYRVIKPDRNRDI